MGGHFVKTQGTFGGIGSVCNFDRLANTKDKLVCIRSKVPRDQVFRIIDDSPQVSKDVETAERFASEMRKVCSFINMPLAANSMNNDKAFELQTRGIVLGIGFDSNKMIWFLEKEKADKLVKWCLDGCHAQHVDLKQVQKPMGSVNDLAQMCPQLKFHKGSGNALLCKFKANKNILLPVPTEMKADMLVVANVA